MRVCFVVTEIFAWGVYGGFGFLTREIGKNLVKKGVEVYVVTKQRVDEGQRTIEELDGIKILGFPKILKSKNLFKLVDADIYHSQEPTIFSYLAKKAKPNKKHIITFQDPRDDKDYENLASVGEKLSIGDRLLSHYKSPFTRWIVHHSDEVYCQAKYITKKCMRMYDLKKEPEFLPNPVPTIPKGNLKKADKPTVVFLGRLDNQKRPWITLDLAKKMPGVDFEILGESHDPEKQKQYVKKYKRYKNIHFRGHTVGKEKSKILGKSWVFINTSAHECLPTAFLEAAAHKCAVLSCRNPDNFASNFGIHVPQKLNNKPKDFEKPLKELINGNWKELGEKAQKYIKENHSIDVVIKKHLEVYNKLLK